MLVLGINLAETSYGKALRDGGTCIANETGILVAVAEERVARQKAAGGFRRSSEQCLFSLGLSKEDIDLAVYSSCCETTTTAVPPALGLEAERVMSIPSHHLSHAYSAFLVSPFEEAIIMVLDSGGNILDQESTAVKQWWTVQREQHSYYVGRGTSINLLDRDFFEPYEAGVGELYRAFTKYLGWESYVYSGKTMGLSAFGNKGRFHGTGLFYFEGDRLKSRVINNPTDPVSMLRRYSAENGLFFGNPRSQTEPIEQIHMDIASYIQEEVEEAIQEKVRKLCKHTGLRDLCLAGGVGLNCLVNSKILENTPIRRIFVQPAAGDQGQCLGNALYGLFKLGGHEDRFAMTAYLGPRHNLDIKHIQRALAPCLKEFEIAAPSDVLDTVAELLASGRIVGWFQGRSEFGPRALGNRSILADPRSSTMKELVNAKVKQREPFLPFAPTILAEYTQDYFDTTVSSPFMLLAPIVKPEKRDEIPAVTHVDGTARLQTVSRADNPMFYDLIKAFYRKTGVPILLNTSLNSKDQPICETISDAIQCLVETDLDYLVIGNYLIRSLAKS